MRTAKALTVDAGIARRFWANVKDGPLHPTLGTPCRLWAAYTNKRGYGVVGISGNRTELAHRVAAVLRDGPLAAGELVLHLHGCSSKRCVEHTYRGSQKQNMADAVAAGLMHGRRTSSGKAQWVNKHRALVLRDAAGRIVGRLPSTKEIREQVFARAKGRCECGCNEPLRESGQLDHALGRAKAAQAVSNCWALTVQHHDDKTQNRPSRAHWLKRFGEHCKRYGFVAELELARAKYLVLKQKGFA